MASHHKRQSLAGLFDGLAISKTVYKTVNLPNSIRDTIRSKLPAKAKFTLNMDPNYDYNRFTPEPDEVFKESINYFEEVQSLILDLKDRDISYEEQLVESMVMMIFTSNSLENAGSSHPVTLRLCKEILAGREVSEDIGERDGDYKPIQEYLQSKKAPSDHAAVLRSRKQIIQHAYALKYITYCIVVKGEALSEQILLQTHKILTDGIDAENAEKDKSDSYGGIYRTSKVGWTFHTFAEPEKIPRLMAEAVAAFNLEVKEAEAKC